MGSKIHSSHTPAANVKRNKFRIWLSLLIALGLHGLILLLPFSRQTTNTHPESVQIELRLTEIERPAVAKDISNSEPEILSRQLPDPTVQPEPTPLLQTPAQAASSTATVNPLVPLKHDFERLNAAEKSRLAHAILSSQFMTEESVANQIFGEPDARYSIKSKKGFHYPEKANMVAMLNQPMQELPFEYTPGLIHFAYAPGVKGDLQRYWDIITPEFGWTTKYGTEVKCRWVLVIAGCGWK